MRTPHQFQKDQIRRAEELLFVDERKSSFTKGLFSGVFNSECVIPFPQPSAAERHVIDGFIHLLDDFASKHIDPNWIDRHATIPDEIIEGLGRLGLLGTTIPAKYNGLGMSQSGYCRGLECIARHCASTALFVNAHQSIGLKALLLFATEEQRRHWLPPLARGDKLAAFALTEAEAGSDASNVQTRAVFDPAKNIYRINGRKQWITNGSLASVLTVMARTELDTPEGKQDRITAFLVTPEMPGFRVVNAALEKCGVRGTTTSILEFKDMEVPAENILGPLGGGLKVALTVLDYGRISFGASCTGIAKQMLRRAIDHAQNRRQFQRPLGSFSLVKKKIATIAAKTYAMEAATYLTAGLLDRGKEDVMLEAAILKVYASEALWEIIYETMQILGGRALFTDQPYERIMRDARLNMIGEGSNEVLRAFIGAVGMRDIGQQLQQMAYGLHHPFSEWHHLYKLAQRHLPLILKTPKIALHNKALAQEALQLGTATRRFSIAVTRLLVRHKENIVEKQILLDRIASCAIALYTTTAVLSKLDTELVIKQGSVDQLSEDLAAGRLYCILSFKMINEQLATLFKNNDATIEDVADRLTGI